MVKLKFQHFWPPDVKSWLTGKTLMLGKIEGRRRKGGQRMRWFDSITDLMDMSEQAAGVGEGWGSLVCCSPWGHKELDTTEQLNNSSNSNQKNATASTPWAQNTQKISIMNHNTRGIHNSYIVCLEAVSTRPLPVLSTWYNRFFMLLKLISSKLISFYILFQ